MKSIQVGARTFVVENETAADLLLQAAKAYREWQFDDASRLTKLAARLESGTATAMEAHTELPARAPKAEAPGTSAAL